MILFICPVVHVKKEVDIILDFNSLYNIAYVCFVIGTLFILGIYINDYLQDRKNYSNAKKLLNTAYNELLEEYNCVEVNITSGLPYIIQKTSNGGILVKCVNDENIEYFFQAKQCFDKHAADGVLTEKYYNRVVDKLDYIVA